MRRSSVVQLTLLPVLATAAVASAGDPPTAAPSDPPTAAPSDPPTAGPSDPPTAGMPDSSYDSVWYGAEDPIEAPIAPPGMTPSIIELTCDEDPNWRLRADCDWGDGYYYDGGVIRGGFGHYFYGGYGG